jgi:DNA-directed RNA polymerase specialized sigma24 family protein
MAKKHRDYDFKEIPVDFQSGFISGYPATEIPESAGLWYNEEAARLPGEIQEEWKKRLKCYEKKQEEKEKMLKEIRKIIEKELTQKQREAILLVLKGKTMREIGVVMGVNPKTVWEYLYGKKGRGGAIKKIKKLLGLPKHTPQKY